MGTYIEYQVDEESTLLIKVPINEEGGLEEIANVVNNTIILKSEKNFQDAFNNVKKSALIIKQKFEDLKADEVKVKFGLITTGKLGNFAIGEVGVEANYEITLIWKNNNTTIEK